MKSGTAKGSIERQLQGGLVAMIEHLPDDCQAQLRAGIVVAARLESQLLNLVRAKKLHLEYRGERVDVRVLKPGASITLPS